jgi:hypothetical protein
MTGRWHRASPVAVGFVIVGLFTVQAAQTPKPRFEVASEGALLQELGLALKPDTDPLMFSSSNQSNARRRTERGGRVTANAPPVPCGRCRGMLVAARFAIATE